MTTDVLIKTESLRETFREWHAEQESLDAQLAESLAALSAYQSHLDTWQKQLARERDELHKSREQWERDRTAAEKDDAIQAHSSAEALSELQSARARGQELKTALEQQQGLFETERAKWAEELRQLREIIAQRPEPAGVTEPRRESESRPQADHRPAANSASADEATQSPVLSSIMEQFGKLRQQRASDRQTLKKTAR